MSQLGHYLRDYIHHQRAQRDICVSLDAFEEVADAFEEGERHSSR